MHRIDIVKCICAPCVYNGHRDQKNVSGSEKLELQMGLRNKARVVCKDSKSSEPLCLSDFCSHKKLRQRKTENKVKVARINRNEI